MTGGFVTRSLPRAGWGGRKAGARRGVLVALALAGLWAALELELDPRALAPSAGGLELVGRFFAGAVSPAFSYESGHVPEGAPPLLLRAAEVALRTLLFAAAAVSLSLLLGLAFGFLASTAWWAGDPAGGEGRARRLLARSAAPALYGATRGLITLLRSVHELIWAVIFLSALGLSNLAAVVAIAIPYTGTFAKVFSEMIDEAPRDTARALRAAGASPLQVFAFGLLPRALPDLSAYALYRFECGLRSAAVLGFFGIPTLGLAIEESCENAYYGEVWTYLYTLFALVVVFDAWSGALRRRLVA